MWMAFNIPGMLINLLLSWLWIQLLFLGLKTLTNKFKLLSQRAYPQEIQGPRTNDLTRICSPYAITCVLLWICSLRCLSSFRTVRVVRRTIIRSKRPPTIYHYVDCLCHDSHDYRSGIKHRNGQHSITRFSWNGIKSIKKKMSRFSNFVTFYCYVFLRLHAASRHSTKRDCLHYDQHESI